MSKSAVAVTVVVPTYRRPGRLRVCLTALAAQSLDRGSFEVIVVDDCSGDQTPAVVADVAERTGLPVRLVQMTEGNRGPATARNAGWRQACGPVVAFTDDDCTPGRGWLAAGLAVMDAGGEGLGVVQGRTTAPDGVSVDGLTDWYTWQVIDGPTAHFEACNVFYRRSALRVVDGFEEDIPWPWGEDAELGWKVLGRGWQRGFADLAVVAHPVERRGFRWYLRTGLRDATLVGVACAHPAFRESAYWRPWAYRRADVALLSAIAGVALAIRWHPIAAAAALPYLWWQRPSVRQPHFVRLCAQIPLVDAARVLGQVRGGLRHRTIVI